MRNYDSPCRRLDATRRAVVFGTGALALALTACAGAPQPTILKSGLPGLTVSCNGTGYDWADCYQAARIACPKGFDIDDRELVVLGTVRRTLFFACK
jgi:hypothetical protein